MPPQVTSVSRKPLSIALEEISAGKITYHRLEVMDGATGDEAARAIADQAAPGPLSGRRIVLGVSGGIAAYKAVEVCRRLVDAGAHVAPVLTPDATRFVGALTFSALGSEPAQRLAVGRL